MFSGDQEFSLTINRNKYKNKDFFFFLKKILKWVEIGPLIKNKNKKTEDALLPVLHSQTVVNILKETHRHTAGSASSGKF